MTSVSVIGAGKVGATLGILLHRHGYDVREVYSRTPSSAESAVRAIGAGRAVAKAEDLSPADILLVTTSDNALGEAAALLACSPAARPGAVAVHCSGATPSAVLEPLRAKGLHIASVHPVKTFTDPARDADSFPGTWCGAEGDAAALSALEPLFQALGGRTFRIDGEKKALYHAAVVFMCNYLFPVFEAGLRCYEAAGVPRALAGEISAPIVHATVDNALNLGPAAALTGPIARGDDKVVERQIAALDALDPGLKALYAVLGRHTADLSESKGSADPAGLARIRALFGEN